MFPVIYYVFYVVRLASGQYIHNSDWFDDKDKAIEFGKKLITSDVVRAVRVERISFDEEED